MKRRIVVSIGIGAVLLASLYPANQATAGRIVAWGSYSGNVPAGDDFVAVAAAWGSLALRADGSLAAWGTPWALPAGNDFVAISASNSHNLALRRDGSIVAWGDVTQVPPGNDFTAIAAGGSPHSVALRADGSLVTWYGDSSPTVSPAGNDFVAISAGSYECAALRGNGTVAVWGSRGSLGPISGTFAEVSAGEWYGVARKPDGSLLEWGSSACAPAEVPTGNDFIAISAGDYTRLALRANGSIVGWGRNDSGQCTVPTGDTYAAICMGVFHALALTKDPVPVISNVEVSVSGAVPRVVGGGECAVTWETVGNISDVNIAWSVDAGITWQAICSDVTNSGTYDWVVPQIDSNDCLVRVSDASNPAIYGISSLFEIRTPIPVEVTLKPNLLCLTEPEKWVTAFVLVPRGHRAEDVVPSSVMLAGKYQEQWIWFDGQIVNMLKVRFHKAEVTELQSIGEVELSVSGEFADGTLFAGYDRVRVTDCPFRKAAAMTLSADTFCNNHLAMDFNGDCQVNLMDYAIFADGWLSCSLDPQSACGVR